MKSLCWTMLWKIPGDLSWDAQVELIKQPKKGDFGGVKKQKSTLNFPIVQKASYVKGRTNNA